MDESEGFGIIDNPDPRSQALRDQEAVLLCIRWVLKYNLHFGIQGADFVQHLDEAENGEVLRHMLEILVAVYVVESSQAQCYYSPDGDRVGK
jgi:hypothetical protein